MSYHVYLVSNRTTGTVYVGLTETERLAVKNCVQFGVLPTRFAEHLGAMNRQDHFNFLMQDAWDSGSGQSEWTFKVIEDLPEWMCETDARLVEKSFIQELPDVYNIRGRRHRPTAPLTDAIIDDVLARLKKGESGKSIALATGISTGSVSLINKANRLETKYRARTVYDCAAAAADAVRTSNGRFNVGKTAAKHNIPYATFLRFVRTNAIK